MRKGISGEGLEGIIDPHNVWPETPAKQLFEECGFLPTWVISYSVFKGLKDPEATNLKKWLDNSYGYGLYEMTGGFVTDDYIHKYPEDPDLFPLIVMKVTSGEEFVQWQHGICAMRQAKEDAWFITRMD